MKKDGTVKVGRAWNGKLEHVNGLLAWLYDKDILTITEKREKDITFRTYYRYYNDGDLPRNTAGETDEEIEEYIEWRVEEYATRILKKYAGKYNRKEYRLATKLDKLKREVARVEEELKSVS